MSWISNIAGRAEEILNKIDQNAAVVLKKERNSKKESRLDSNISPLESTRDFISSVPSSPMTLKKSSSSKDFSTSVVSLSTSHHYPDLLGSLGHDSTKSEETQYENDLPRRSPELNTELVQLETENLMLKNEVRSLNNELSHLLNRVKETDTGCSTLETRVSHYESESHLLRDQLEAAQKRLSEAQNNCRRLQTENERLSGAFSENERFKTDVNQLKNDFLKKEQEFNIQIDNLKRRIEESELSSKELLSELSEAKERADRSRQELEQYRVRAQKTLAEKRRIIEELSSKVTTQDETTSSSQQQEDSSSSSNNGGMDDWSSECEALRDKLELSRKETKRAEERLEFMRAELSRKQSELVAQSQTNANKLLSLRQEMESLRDDHQRTLNEVNDKLRNREAEVKSLRGQANSALAAKRSQNGLDNASAADTKIANLTSALVRKQAALEQVTADAAQLRLQLERTRNKWKEYNLQSQGSHANDTDDVKARVPDRVFDLSYEGSGVMRSVKRVYLAVDSMLGSAVAVLLRTFPMARLFALFYLILLHMMVCLVLYSWTPDTK